MTPDDANFIIEARDERDIRDRIPHAWYAFFGRFGRLTGIQRRAIVPIANGRNVLVNAPTASGKTEALIGPLAERLLAEDERIVRKSGGPRSARDTPKEVGLVVIAPTRALCNDLLRRLRRPLQAVGMKVDIKTGDSPSFNEKNPPRVLITTPESMDSMIVRRPAVLRGIRAIVLDELHLLANTVRGDQLWCLVSRLEKITREPLQKCAASATVADADRLASNYLGADSVIAIDPDARQRAIVAELAPADELSGAIQPIVALYEEAPRRKLLIFSNTRAQVEMLSAMLNQTPELERKVFAHHGSMSRSERLRVEKAFLGAPTAVCVATMTLELGIDIGDVDRVVLLAPPPDVASLLQRVGRGNRGADTTHVLCLFQGHFEQVRFEHLLLCAQRGAIFPDPVAFRPTVIAQQALSLLFQNPRGWISVDALRSRLPVQTMKLWNADECEAILDALTKDPGYMRKVSGGRYVADEAGLALYERGQLHSMIADSPEVEVVDKMTQRTIGTIARPKADAGSFSLGGQRYSYTRRSSDDFAGRNDKVFVSSAGGVDKANFIAREAPRYSMPLAQDFGRFLGTEEGVFVVEPITEKQWRLSHFQGSIRGIFIQELLKKLGYGPKGGSGPFFSVITQLPKHDEPLAGEKRIRRATKATLPKVVSRVSRALGAGPFRSLLPEEIMERWITASVDIEQFIHDVTNTRVVVKGPM